MTPSSPFTPDLHLAFLRGLEERESKSLEYTMMGHIRINALYWALTSLCLLGHGPWTEGFDKYSPLSRQEIIQFVRNCKHPSGGYGGNEGLDAHLLFTLSAIQILVILDAEDELDKDSIITYITGLQQADGSFCGDEFGEVDTRFSYCAVAALSLLQSLDNSIDKEAAAGFIDACRNFDGGYGVVPGCESHAGQRRQDLIRTEELGEWLVFRQLPNGGLNGRPEKLEDVCYSWWVLASLHLLNPELSWLSKDDLSCFIRRCQDPVTGGIADRPGDLPDVFHTLFGLAGLSLMRAEVLEPIDSAYCMPVRCIKRLSQ